MKARECFVLLACCLSCVCHAQQYRLEVEPGTPESAMIEHIKLVSETDARLHLMEQFLARYPRHSATQWLYDQMRSVYVNRGESGKVAALCEKLLDINPLDLDSAHQSLKIAEEGKDSLVIFQKADRAGAIARQVTRSPRPKAPDELAAWTQRAEFAGQIATYVEYLYFKRMVETSDPKARMSLSEDFLKRFPQSGYAKSIAAHQFVALRQLSDQAGALALAERLVHEDPSNVDALYLLAQDRFQRKIEPEKVLFWAARIVELLNNGEKPRDLPDSDWNQKRMALLGSSFWMSGSIYGAQERFAMADKSLRAALPFVRGGPLTGAVLFYLGWANYRLKNIPDAVRFNKDCLNVKSSYSPQAARNLAVIKAEFKVE